ncbi:hypothetical protein EYB26_005680 [Talaromyces marneffei]|uniref:uncharacterized protein n=1 Tax=Talaromyces marneffei TaxID=37727 RepID=UPI0012AA0D5C|nr:uncharacterized protein EYB26_005680 [Talaromyces marneffei]QGA18002.1 hypothetical protein EYB26_005680 [Talaromyces marneffei]
MPTPTPNTSQNKKQQQQPQPRNQHIFDPWNTSSTGHQRAENPYSRTTEWRDTRREKLARQFQSDRHQAPSSGGSLSGGRGRSCILGNEGRREEGEWKWMTAQEAARNELGVADIRRYMGGISKAQQPQPQPQPQTKPESESEQQCQPMIKEKFAVEPAEPTTIQPQPDTQDPSAEVRPEDSTRRKKKGIFTSLTFYINGFTYPTISDHKLKRLLADEGGSISLYLARKSVTHVILGASGLAGSGNGARKTGGLLSAGKMQKEVLSKTSGFGKGVKYVNVEWVVESIKAGKKLPEARFAPSSVVPSSSIRGNGLERYNTTSVKGGGVGVPAGQKSVYDMFNKSTRSSTRSNEDIG